MAVNSVTTSNIRNLGGVGSVDGNRVGSATTSKVAFFGSTPVVQPSSTSQSAVAATTTTTATTTALQADVDAIRTLLLRIRTDMVTLGLIKGST